MVRRIDLSPEGVLACLFLPFHAFLTIPHFFAADGDEEDPAAVVPAGPIVRESTFGVRAFDHWFVEKVKLMEPVPNESLSPIELLMRTADITHPNRTGTEHICLFLHQNRALCLVLFLNEVRQTATGTSSLGRLVTRESPIAISSPCIACNNSHGFIFRYATPVDPALIKIYAMNKPELHQAHGRRHRDLGARAP